MDKLGRKFISSIIFFVAISCFVSFIINRPMWSEGAFWYYFDLCYRMVFLDRSFHREFGYILQGPAVAILYLSDYFHWNFGNIAAIYTLSFLYSFHGLFSFLYCLRILKHENKAELIVFPLLSLLFGTLPASTYAVALALPALSLFWPLFFKALFFKDESIFEYSFIFFLSLSMTFCYEATFVFHMMIMLIAFRKYLFEKKFKFSFFLLLTSSISIVWQFFVISKVPESSLGAYYQSFFSQLDWYRTYGFLVTILILVTLFMPKKFMLQRIVPMFLGFLFVAISIWYLYNLIEFYRSDIIINRLNALVGFNSRTTALPYAFVLSALAYFYTTRIENNPRLNNFIKFMLIVAALLSVGTDLKMSSIFKNETSALSEITFSRPGCISLNSKEFQRISPSQIALSNYALPYASALQQVLAGVEPIQTLVVTSEKFDGKDDIDNACADGNPAVLRNVQGFEIELNKGRILFQKGIKSTN